MNNQPKVMSRDKTLCESGGGTDYQPHSRLQHIDTQIYKNIFAAKLQYTKTRKNQAIERKTDGNKKKNSIQSSLLIRIVFHTKLLRATSSSPPTKL